MLIISRSVSIPDAEILITHIRAQGAGGQNVNKVSCAIHLRFDINASSLPDIYKERLQKLDDYRITKDGIVIIKAQRYRTQEQNREDALQRLQELIKRVAVSKKKRRPTKINRAVKQKRVDAKVKRGLIKANRNKKIDL